MNLLNHRLILSAPALILLSATWIAVVDNTTLWSRLFTRLDLNSTQGAGYTITLLCIIILVFSLPLFILGQRILLKPLIAAFIVFSGSISYFTSELGIVFDKEMVRNTLETISDRNTQESLELLSTAFAYSLLISTVIPLVFIFWVQVRQRGFLLDNVWRVGYLFVMLGVVSALILGNFKSVTYVSRENRDLETVITPWYAIKSANKLLESKKIVHDKPFKTIGKNSAQNKDQHARRVGIMVVGETARADHFSLNGYDRQTNPKLSKRDIINFSNVRSCGTSTAFSVPCMFSFLNLSNYTPEKAASRSNALDVLSTAGVDVVWIDSNSSCKGVCKRIGSINIMAEPPNKDSPLYVDGAYQDHFLLPLLNEHIDNSSNDLLIVLHTMGSHGPAYYRRYPETAAPFQPACRRKAPQTCENSEIVNAYDNTIHYTDSFLAALIDKLEARGGQNFMFYASDHGESLGENGIYLHGLPRSIAPDSQRQVPMIAWFSEELTTRIGNGILNRGVTQDDRKLSHDVISASLLGLFNVVSEAYKPELDIFKYSPTGIPQAKLLTN